MVSKKHVGILCTSEDTTERKQTDATICGNAKLLAATQRMAKIGGWIFDVQMQTMHWTEETYRLHGYNPDQIKSGSTEHIERGIMCYDEQDRPVILGAFQKCINNGIAYDMELHFTPLNGQKIWVRTAAKAEIEKGKIVRVIGNIMDITAHKQREIEIERQLLEKEIILKETHHRIKNNFNTIGNLLSLQKETTENEETKTELNIAIRRLKGMSLLYDRLLLTNDYKTTSVKEYLQNLIDEIITLISKKDNITVEKQIDDIHLNPKQLFPIGLIVNESITNIMKYAFAKKESGLIKVSLQENKGDIILIIQDNGHGLSKDFDINTHKGFGLMLIKMLSEQLGGSFSMKNQNGTRCVLKFPK